MGMLQFCRISHGYTIKTFSNIHLKLNMAIRLMTSTAAAVENSAHFLWERS